MSPKSKNTVSELYNLIRRDIRCLRIYPGIGISVLRFVIWFFAATICKYALKQNMYFSFLTIKFGTTAGYPRSIKKWKDPGNQQYSRKTVSDLNFSFWFQETFEIVYFLKILRKTAQNIKIKCLEVPRIIFNRF